MWSSILEIFNPYEDEHCDLTLDKMVNETEKVGKRNIVHTIKTPTDIKELQEQLNKLAAKGNTFIMVEPQKKSFFAKVKTFFSKQKK